MARSSGRAALLALALAARAAHADDDLARARTAVAASDYLTAKPALTSALARGTNSPDELAEIYRLSGIVAAATGDVKAATEAFERLLALSPKATLPDGTSPKIGRPFAAAGAFFKGKAPLAVKTETSADPPSITLVVTADPLAMVVKARAWVVADGKPEKVVDAAGKDRITLELPAGKRLDVRIAALDDHGNRLAELGSKDVPIVILGKAPAEPAHVEPKPPPPPPKVEVVERVAPVAPPPSRPIYLSHWLYGGLAVAAAGVGGYFVLQARSAQSDLDAIVKDSLHHPNSDAAAATDRGKHAALMANVSFAAAGTFAVAAAILYLTRPTYEIAIQPMKGGTAVTLEVPF